MNYIWKNYNSLPKYVGFNHYRRYFRFVNNIPHLDDIFKNYDVILKAFSKDSNKKFARHFQDSHLEPALEEAKIIKEIKPEYYKQQ